MISSPSSINGIMENRRPLSDPGLTIKMCIRDRSRSVHELGMRVVSEGVETDEQRAFAEECCCDWIQGYYYAKPMPGEDAKRFLAERIEKS